MLSKQDKQATHDFRKHLYALIKHNAHNSVAILGKPGQSDPFSFDFVFAEVQVVMTLSLALS